MTNCKQCHKKLMPLIAVGIRNINVGFYCKRCKRIIPGKDIKVQGDEL
jgi:RNase P subunit RPR2